jgi:hypothetical protein
MSVEFRARRTFLFVEPNAVELDKLKVQYVCDEWSNDVIVCIHNNFIYRIVVDKSCSEFLYRLRLKWVPSLA